MLIWAMRWQRHEPAVTLNSNVFRFMWKIEGCRELLSSIPLWRTTQLLMCLVGKCVCASIWVFSLLCQCEPVYIIGSMIRQVSECTFDCSLMRAVTWCSQIPQRSPPVPVKFPVLQVREHSPLSCPNLWMRSGQLHREISFGHLRITVPSLLYGFLWV